MKSIWETKGTLGILKEIPESNLDSLSKRMEKEAADLCNTFYRHE
jgi:hypothetical protein